LRESFEDMARIAEIEVNTSPSIKATGIEPIHLNYGGTDMERQAKAASWAGMGAAALGGIAGIITLASVPIAGPVFPLVAAAIGALIGLGEGVQKVSQQQRDAACAAAELQVKRLFDGARLQCRDMVRESRGQIAERYMNSLKERHTALVAECDAALQSTHRDLHETESLAAIRKREIEEVRSIQGRVARLLQQIGARSGEPQ
jgi:hypothetical protein